MGGGGCSCFWVGSFVRLVERSKREIVVRLSDEVPGRSLRRGNGDFEGGNLLLVFVQAFCCERLVLLYSLSLSLPLPACLHLFLQPRSRFQSPSSRRTEFFIGCSWIWYSIHLRRLAELILHPSPLPHSRFQPASFASLPPCPPLLSVVAGVLRS